MVYLGLIFIINNSNDLKYQIKTKSKGRITAFNEVTIWILGSDITFDDINLRHKV